MLFLLHNCFFFVHSNELLMIPIFILSASPVLQRPSKRKAVEVGEMTVSFFVTRQNLGRVNAYTVFCPILTSWLARHGPSVGHGF